MWAPYKGSLSLSLASLAGPSFVVAVRWVPSASGAALAECEQSELSSSSNNNNNSGSRHLFLARSLRTRAACGPLRCAHLLHKQRDLDSAREGVAPVAASCVGVRLGRAAGRRAPNMEELAAPRSAQTQRAETQRAGENKKRSLERICLDRPVNYWHRLANEPSPIRARCGHCGNDFTLRRCQAAGATWRPAAHSLDSRVVSPNPLAAPFHHTPTHPHSSRLDPLAASLCRSLNPNRFPEYAHSGAKINISARSLSSVARPARDFRPARRLESRAQPAGPALESAGRGGGAGSRPARRATVSWRPLESQTTTLRVRRRRSACAKLLHGPRAGSLGAAQTVGPRAKCARRSARKSDSS